MNTLILDQQLNILTVYRVVRQDLPRKYVPTKAAARPCDCFVCVLQGRTEYIFDNRRIRVGPGDILYLAAGSRYAMDIQTAPYQVIFADFDFTAASIGTHPAEPIIVDSAGSVSEGLARLNPAGFSSKPAARQSQAFTPDHSAEFEQLFSRLLERWMFKQPGYPAACKAVLYEIYAKLIRTARRAGKPDRLSQKLEPAMALLSGTPAAVSVIQLAQACGMSTVHFRRLFKQAHAVPPVKYITALRVDQAKELLRYGMLTVTQIADRLGFDNVYYFSKVFKQETGLSPCAYRNSMTAKSGH